MRLVDKDASNIFHLYYSKDTGELEYDFKIKISIHQLWKRPKEENMSQDQFKQLLIDNGVIINKNDVSPALSQAKKEWCEILREWKESDDYR